MWILTKFWVKKSSRCFFSLNFLPNYSLKTFQTIFRRKFSANFFFGPKNWILQRRVFIAGFFRFQPKTVKIWIFIGILKLFKAILEILEVKKSNFISKEVEATSQWKFRLARPRWNSFFKTLSVRLYNLFLLSVGRVK